MGRMSVNVAGLKAAGREAGMPDIPDTFQEKMSPRDPSMFMEAGDELEAHREASQGAVVAPLMTRMPRKNKKSICIVFLCQWIVRFNNSGTTSKKANLRSARRLV